MRQIYLIKDTKTNTWCYSSKQQRFSNDFNIAAIFMQKENADKAIKTMKRGIDPKTSSYPYWSAYIDDIEHRFAGSEEFVNQYSQFLIPELEVIAFNLTANVL